MNELDESELERVVLPLLNLTAPISGKQYALSHFLELSGSNESRDFICNHPKFLEGIVTLKNDSDSGTATLALKCLVNLTIQNKICQYVLKHFPGLGKELAAIAVNPSETRADDAGGALANLTRSVQGAETVAKDLHEGGNEPGLPLVERMVFALCQAQYNPTCNLHCLALVLQNLTQVTSVRAALMSKCLLQRLLCFTTFEASSIRRGGIVGMLKNCCFDIDRHDWLLGDQVDILPSLLLPLAGPEEFDDEIMDDLPLDLQCLPAEKTRELEASIRHDLLEALMKLTASKSGLEFLKKKNTYYILRELHKWEKDPVNWQATMNVIDSLIGDREPGMENLHEVKVPAEYHEKFEKERTQELKELQEELGGSVNKSQENNND